MSKISAILVEIALYIIWAIAVIIVWTIHAEKLHN